MVSEVIIRGLRCTSKCQNLDREHYITVVNPRPPRYCFRFFSLRFEVEFRKERGLCECEIDNGNFIHSTLSYLENKIHRTIEHVNGDLVGDLVGGVSDCSK